MKAFIQISDEQFLALPFHKKIQYVRIQLKKLDKIFESLNLQSFAE